MAASTRLLVRRVIRLSRRIINVSAAGVASRHTCSCRVSTCRCFSDSTAERNTHFGFETVPETEKAKRGEIPENQELHLAFYSLFFWWIPVVSRGKLFIFISFVHSDNIVDI